MMCGIATQRRSHLKGVEDNRTRMEVKKRVGRPVLGASFFVVEPSG